VKKIKNLLPTLKENKRYILYEIKSEKKIGDTMGLIEDSLRGFIGDVGLARAGLRFIKSKGNRGIMQVNNKSLDYVRAGLATIVDLKGDRARIRTLKV